MSEFDIIQRYFASDEFPAREDVVLGIGDDGAVMRVPDGQELVTVVDTLVSGVHFPTASSAYSIGYKALAANLSDLAAMGAKPCWFTLALTLPLTLLKSHPEWLAEFSAGLAELAKSFDVALVGGDTTRGPLTVTVQAVGCIAKGRALTRRAAQSGDDVYITGTTGDAAAGLAIMQGNLRVENGQLADYLQERFNKPQPRVQFGQALVGLANSVIDVSDGLLADLSHITRQSQVAAEIQLGAVPVSEALRSLPDQAEALDYALAGGEDFELCFTAPAGRAAEINKLAEQLAVPCTRIGSIMDGDGIRCINAAGQEVLVDNRGYDHFPQ